MKTTQFTKTEFKRLYGYYRKNTRTMEKIKNHDNLNKVEELLFKSWYIKVNNEIVPSNLFRIFYEAKRPQYETVANTFNRNIRSRLFDYHIFKNKF